MIAITFTIVAVFVPVSFMGGIAGQYFKQFGLVVAFAVIFSLLVARLITPLLAAYFMRSKGHDEREGWLLRAYTRLVRSSVRHQYIAVALGLAIFAASIGSFFLLPSGFLPTEDTGRTLLAIELPPGSPLDETKAVTDAVARQIGARPDVKSVFVNGGRLMGGAVGSAAEVRRATLIINLTPRKERKLGQARIKEEISRSLAEVPDIRYWFLLDNGRQQIQLVVSGRDAAAVNRVAADMASQAKHIPLIANVVSTAELDRPELRVVPISDIAADLGVSTEAISEAVRIATIGDIGANLAKFDVGDRQVPIRVQLDERARAERQILESLKVVTASGATVPLSAVARFELAQGPTAIDRYDRTRRVLVGADLVGNAPLGKAVEQMLKLPAARNLPAGVELKEFGDAEIMGEVFASFAAAMGAGIMMVYAVLVLLFGSFLQPVTILFSLPLVHRRRHRRARRHRPVDQPAGGDRHPDADGHRHQERHHAGRLRHRGDAPRHAPHRGHRRCRPQARPPHRHDHHRHDRRHAAGGDRLGFGRRVPRPHGHRRDRRPAVLHAAVPGVRARRVRRHGRHRPPRLARVQPLRGAGG